MMTKIMTAGLILLFIFSGAFNTTLAKLQNTHYIYQGPYYKQFFHPYLQTTLMFVAELLALPIFYLHRYWHKAEYGERRKLAQIEGKLLHMNKLYLSIPCLFDLLASAMVFIALNFISVSAFQIMEAGSIVSTFIFSVILLKMKIEKHSIWGSVLAVVGIVIVGSANILFSQSQSSSSSSHSLGYQIVGYVLMMGSLLFSGLFFTSQQKLVSKYHLEPLEIVGFQGLFGLIASAGMVIGLNFTPCSFGADACVFDEAGIGYFQNLQAYLRQVGGSAMLKSLIGITVLVTFVYNIVGITITKNINALARVIALMSKTVVLWSIGIIATIGLGHRYPNYRWEKLDVPVIVLQLVGFVFLIVGNLVYDRLIPLPWGSKNLIPVEESEEKYKGMSSDNSIQI